MAPDGHSLGRCHSVASYAILWARFRVIAPHGPVDCVHTDGAEPSPGRAASRPKKMELSERGRGHPLASRSPSRAIHANGGARGEAVPFHGGVSRRTKLMAAGARGADNRAPSRTALVLVRRQPRRGRVAYLGVASAPGPGAVLAPCPTARREALGANPSASNVLIRLIYRRVRERPPERLPAPPKGIRATPGA